MSDLLEAVRRHARERPGTIALAGDREAVCYGDLPRHIARRALMLEHAACRIVAIDLENGPEWVLWDLACVEAGVVCVPLPAFFTPGQRRHACAAAGVDHVVTSRGLVPAGGAASALPPGTAKVTFTSGSTAAPKGVCLPQRALEAVAAAIVEAVAPGDGARHLSILPLAVLLENVAGVYAALMAGCTCCVYGARGVGVERPFDPDYARLVAVLHADGITSAILVPELLRGLVAAVERGRVLLPALRFLAVGGARVAPGTIMRARAAGLPAFEGYGLSECGSVVSLNVPAHDRPGSAGRLLAHVRAEERDGEIVVTNPAFLGYIGSPHAGPLFTGDLGSIDEEGFVHLQGRARNVFVTAFGRNIAPEWVESALLEEPAIAQAIVYGESMARPGALVVSAGAGMDPGAAIARANLRLPEYARIGDYRVVPPFTPEAGLLTANGRPRREEIHRMYRIEPHRTGAVS